MREGFRLYPLCKCKHRVVRFSKVVYSAYNQSELRIVRHIAVSFKVADLLIKFRGSLLVVLIPILLYVKLFVICYDFLARGIIHTLR